MARSLLDLEKEIRNLFNRGGQAVNNYTKGVQQRFNTPSKLAPPLPANNPIRSFVNPIVNEAKNYITKQAPAAQRTLGLVLNNPYQRDQSIQHYTNVFRNNSFQNSIKDVGLDLYNTGKFAANTLGGAKMLTGGLLNSVKTILPTAAISGGLNKAMGGSFLEGAGQGVAISPSIRGITGITNPFIERTTQRLAPRIAPKLTNNPIGNYLTTSTIRGAQNIPEGAAIDATLGHRPMGAMSVGLDFASGFLPGGGRVGRASNVNANAKVEPMHPDDRDFVTKTLARMLENKDKADYDIRFRKQDEEQLRELAGFYMNKEYARKARFQDLAQELFERAKIDAGERRFDLPSMGIVDRKGFTAKGSFTNTRADQIAPKFRGTTKYKSGEELPTQGQGITTENFRYSNPKTNQQPLGRISSSSSIPPSVKSKSVLDDFYREIEKGRKIRDKAQGQVEGGRGMQMRSQLVDRLSPIYDFMKLQGDPKKISAESNPYKRMRLLAGASGKSEAFIEKNFAPVIKKEQGRLKDLSALLAFDRERELIGRGLLRKRGTADIDRGTAEIQAKYGVEGFKTLQQSAEEIRKVGKDMLLSLKEAGIIDDASYNKIKANNEFYTPFQAIDYLADNLEKGKFGTGSYNVAKQDVVKKIGNYEGGIVDPLESLIQKIPKVISLTEKNKAMQSLVNLKKQFPDVYDDLITPAKGDSVPQGMGTFNVFENGVNKRYMVPDYVETAIKNLDAESSNILVNLSKWQAQMLRAGATGLNIGFIPTNIARDFQDALTTELSEKGAKSMMRFLASYPGAIMSAARKDDLYKQWLDSGGAQSTMTEQIFKRPTQSVKGLTGQKNIIKTVINGPRSLIEFANRVGEQSTRLARFKSGLGGGETAMEAAFKSRDISLDFAKAGTRIKTLNSVIPFLNAGIQGSEKLLRLYKSNPKAATAYTGLLFGTPAVMLYQHNSQFEDWNDIPNGERQQYWIMLARDRTPEERANNDPIPAIKIPKGFLGRMVANTAESALDFMKQKDPQGFATAMLQIASGVSPIGVPYNKEELGQTVSTLTPPGAQATIEGLTNTNLYFGNSIVPQSLRNLPASEQYKEKTPAIYKAAGQVTGKVGISPLVLENTVNTMGGGVGRQLATLFSGDLKGATVDQVTRRFSGARGGKKIDEMYDLIDKEKQYTALRNKQLKEAYNAGNDVEFKRLSQGMSKQQISTLIKNQAKKQAEGDMSLTERAFDSLTKEEQSRLLKDRPELKSTFNLVDQAGASDRTTIQDNLLIGNGGNIIDLTPPSKGEGIGAFANRDWNITKAREVWNSEDHTKEQKDAAFKKLNVKAEDVRYDALANYTNDIKAQYLSSKSDTKEKLVENILSGRMRSIGDKIFASDGVIDAMVDEGRLTKAEAKYLKSIDYNKDGTLKQTAAKKGRKGAKVTIKKVSPGKVNFTNFKKSTIKSVKLAKAPVITKPGRIKTLKLKTPIAKISYKIQGPTKFRNTLDSAQRLA